MNGLVFIAIVASIFGVQGKIIVYFESFGTCFGQYSTASDESGHSFILELLNDFRTLG